MGKVEIYTRLRGAFLEHRKATVTAISCAALCVVATFTDNGGFDFWAKDGVWSILPVLTAIAMTVTSKNIILSLCAGLLTGAYLLSVEYLNVLSALAKMPSVLYRAAESAMSGGELASFLIRIIIVGLFVSLYAQWGGLQSVASALLDRQTSKKNAILIRMSVLVLSICLYFDKGARAWTLGRVLRPLAEKNGISRECVAFLADCSSVSVAAVISVWAGYEISLIREGLASSSLTAEGVYAASVLFRFYPALLFVFAFFTALFSRESPPPLNTLRTQPPPANPRFPGVVKALSPLIFLFVILLPIHFFMKVELNDALIPCLGITSVFMACVCLIHNKRNFSDVLFQLIKGVRPVLVPIFAILFSRMLSVVVCALGADLFITDTLVLDVPAPIFPSLVFALGALIGFATGSAYAAMALLTPLSLFMISIPGAEPLVCAAALTGGFLGTHCSPISETTLFASLGADSLYGRRMPGQIPRVLVIGAATVFLGYLPVGYGMPLWAAYAVSIAAMAVAAPIFERLAPLGGATTSSHIWSKIFPIRP